MIVIGAFEVSSVKEVLAEVFNKTSPILEASMYFLPTFLAKH